MKVGIVGDTHFGAAYSLGKIDPSTQLNSRLMDFSDTFNRIIDTFLSKGVTVAVLTGDIFETRHPTASQLKTFSQCLSRAISKGIEHIVIVVGNHDQQRHVKTSTVDLYHELHLNSVHVFASIGSYKLDDSTDLILVPYRDRRMIGGKSSADAISKLQNRIDSVASNLTGNTILVGHLMLEEDTINVGPDEFSLSELMIPLEVFDDLDIVIMGHVHKPGVVSKKKPVILYSGSMEKVSFGERDHDKSTIVIDTDTMEVEIVSTEVRDLYNITLDYSGYSKPLKSGVMKRLIADINLFDIKNKIEDSITKVSVKVKDVDLYYIKQNEIKNLINGKGVHNCSGIYITAVNSRQLRNSKINESLESKRAITSFINSLNESKEMKQRLLTGAKQVIKDVDGK